VSVTNENEQVELGAFSVSLAVKDLSASRSFYEKLGFRVSGGNEAHGYLILVNGSTVIGLFQGMFERNILTFNPGWNGPHSEIQGPFTDVRDLARHLDEVGIETTTRDLPEGGGPGHVVVVDPDGNPILLDQHR